MAPSTSHIVLLPSYNTGPRLRSVVAGALERWHPVMVVLDGCTDGSGDAILDLARREEGLSVVVLPANSGKGAAVLAGLASARDRGFTHALVMDADGQHPAADIRRFMDLSRGRPDAMILGRPVFGGDAPAVRLHGRRISVAFARIETLGPAIADPLCGFRVYPVGPLLKALGTRRGGRRYDFDTEAAVRLFWDGVPPVNASVPVRYFTRGEGGISHFHYLRDNATLALMHARLLAELLLLRWPAVLRRRRRWSAAERDASGAAPGGMAA
jgi:glycosyltransferase involved in cell wall biosynthesis